jgi:hypothetical protein
LTLSRGETTHCGAGIEVVPLVFLPKGIFQLSRSASIRQKLLVQGNFLEAG